MFNVVCKYQSLHTNRNEKQQNKQKATNNNKKIYYKFKQTTHTWVELVLKWRPKD